MKQYQGKKLKVVSINGESVSGICHGATDELVKILPDGEKDVRVIFTRNIFYYTVDGENLSDGFSGIKLYICKNDDLGCPGRRKLSSHPLTIKDLGCEAIPDKPKCDFGCVGNIEIIPSRALRVLLDGMAKVEKIGVKSHGRKSSAGV